MAKDLKDFYFSSTGTSRIMEMMVQQFRPIITNKFKGVVYTEMVDHGEEPMLADEDLQFLGTGTLNDCTHT